MSQESEPRDGERRVIDGAEYIWEDIWYPRRPDAPYVCLCGGKTFQVLAPNVYETKIECTACKRSSIVNSG